MSYSEDSEKGGPAWLPLLLSPDERALAPCNCLGKRESWRQRTGSRGVQTKSECDHPSTNFALANCLPAQRTPVQLQICCLRKISSKPHAPEPRSRLGEI